MKPAKVKKSWYRIRKAVVSDELYLQSDGTWGAWKTSKRFRTQSEAEGFAELYCKDKNAFGLFDYHP